MFKTRRFLLAGGIGAGVLATAAWLHQPGSIYSAADGREGQFQGGFLISDKQVIPDSRYIARFRVLGAELTSSDEYDMPVTVEIRIDTETFTPFGPYDSPTGGNVNDHNHPKDFILPHQYHAGTSFSIKGQSWKRSGGGGESDSDWQSSLRVATNENSANLLVLRNGDPVPDIEPFRNQQKIAFILRDVVDPATNRIRIWDDEVIYLFELGTTNLDSAAADFQDLVVLVTLAEDERFFEGPRIVPNALYD